MAAVRRVLVAPSLLVGAGILLACGDLPDAGGGPVTDATGCITDFEPDADYYPHKADIRHAENFSISYHGHYKVLRARLPATNWGPAVSDVVVLNKCGTPPPELEGDLAGATVIETPVRRFATNSLASALRLRVLGLEDRIVAMPANPYDSVLAERVRTGRVVSASVHGEPHMEGMLVLGVGALVVFTSSLDHADGLSRARDLGVPGIPLLSWAEPTYLGQAEWLKHHAALFDAEAEAEAYFADVEGRYRELAALVEGHEPVPVVWATPMAGGRSWVEAGNWQDEALAAAGGRNVFVARPGESSIVVGAERMLESGAEARVWITNDPDPMALAPNTPLQRIGERNPGRTWHVQRRSDLARDAFDWNETPLVRPDLVLADLIEVLHPGTIPGHELRFLVPLGEGAGGPGLAP